MRKKIDLSKNWQYVCKYDKHLHRKKEISAQIVDLAHQGEKENHCYYRRNFFVEESLRGQSLILKGFGIRGDVKIRINGITLEKGRGIDQPFEIYLEDRLLYGIENHLELEVKSGETPSLVRPMSIEIAPSLHIQKISTSARSVLDQASLHVNVDFSMEASQDCFVRLYQLKHKKYVFLEEKEALHTGVNVQVNMRDVKLWGPYHPKKYVFRVELCKGREILDSMAFEYGFRSLSFERGHLMLNAKTVRLQGAFLEPKESVDHLLLQRLKEAGVDVLLIKEHLRNPEFYESCDQLGILVVQEVNLMEYDQIDFEIFDHLNHPCIILINVLTHSMSIKERFHEYFFMNHMESLLLLDEHSMFTCGELLEKNIWQNSILENEFYPAFGEVGFLKASGEPTRVAKMLGMINNKNLENFFCVNNQSILLLLSSPVELLMNGFSLGQIEPKNQVIIIPDILPKDLGYKKKKANQYLREILQDAVFSSIEESLKRHTKQVKKLEKKWKISKKEILKLFKRYFPKRNLEIKLVILNKK